MTSVDGKITTVIRDKSDRFEAFFRAGEAEALVYDYYTADSLQPVFSGPGTALLRGRDAIVAAFEHLVSTFSDCRMEQVLIHASTDMVQELGRCDLTTVDGETIIGRYSTLWVPTEEGWRVQTDFMAFGDLR